MATVLSPFTTLSSYPGIYTDQPSDGPGTTDIPQPDSESEFFEGAQSVINEAYGDIIRGWGNAILSNAVSMDDVPEFLREQVQGYIDYTTGQPEEVVDVLSGDAELQGELDSVADSLTGVSGTEEEVLTEEELARIRIEERDELARILREQAERDRYFGATADEWNSMSPEERSEQYDRYFEGLFRDAEWQENLANEQKLAEERAKNYGKTDAEWAEMSEEERALQQEAYLQAQEDIEEAQAGLVGLGQSSEEDQEKVGGIFQSATEIAKQAGGLIAKVFESIFTPPDIEELPGGSKWVPPGTIIGVRNELPGGTGGLLGPKFVKTLILAVPTLPGKPLEIRLTDDQGNWLPAGDIGNNIYQQTTRPIRDLVGAVQDKIGEIGDAIQEGTNVFEAILGAGGKILSGPLDILINTMGEDGAAEFLGGIITTELESGFGEEGSETQDGLSEISTEGPGDATEEPTGVSTEDGSGAEDDSEGLGLGPGEDDEEEVTTEEVVTVDDEPDLSTITPDDDGEVGITGGEIINTTDDLISATATDDLTLSTVTPETPTGGPTTTEPEVTPVTTDTGLPPLSTVTPEIGKPPEVITSDPLPPGTLTPVEPEIRQDPIIIVDPIRNPDPEPEPEPEPPPETLVDFIDLEPDPDPVIEVYEPVIPCFVSGTKIDMADRTQKNIEDVLVGDKVQAIDGKIDTVSYVHDIPVQNHVLWTLNGRITATEAHPFLTTEGWKSANPEASAFIYESYGIAIGKLKVGDILVGSSGNVELSSLESKEERVKVYNFTTESTHTYMVDGVVSHNKSIPRPPPIITNTPLPPLPPEDFEPEIRTDPIIVEPPPPEPPPEPPPLVIVEPPPPPPSSGGGGMLGGTPRAYMADLPYQLPKFMGVPYDPGDPVEQLNRIILEGLFSK